MSKINFLAGLPVWHKPVPPGALGLAVGQTWRNREGSMMTVAEHRSRDGRFIMLCPHFALHSYTVDEFGAGKLFSHCDRSRDLVERVTRVYIAGPMTGLPGLNFPAFHAAADDYRKRGCFVINPAEMNGGDSEPEKVAAMTAEQNAEHWRMCMRKDIGALLSCEMIVLLDGWQKSKGARLEHHIAREMGMTINYPEE